MEEAPPHGELPRLGDLVLIEDEAHRRAAPVQGGGVAAGGGAALVVVTHTAPDAALAATVEALADLDIVEAVASVMRVEGD